MEELHTVIVIGASAGGMQPLCQLVSSLSADLPAGILVTMHVGPDSRLAEVLQRCGTIAVTSPQHHEIIRAGHVYVAPSDRHMALKDGRVMLIRSARENSHRPSIDVLFRSAARVYRNLAIGVLFSGYLDDGAAGLYSIKSRGGVTVVQDPKEAAIPDMPAHAINYGVVDHCLPISQIAPLLIKLAKANRARSISPEEEPPDPNLVTELERPDEKAILPSSQLPFVCPDCNGPLFELKAGDFVQIKCIVGHRFSPASLTQAQSDALERALWVAVRSLSDRKKYYEYAAARALKNNQMSQQTVLEESIKATEQDLKTIREIIERL